MMGSFVKLGPFSISLVLIPIVIGAATCGIKISAWLGLVFGVVVLVSGDAAAFLAVNIPGTIITVILKGVACGFTAGLAYTLLERKSKTLAVVVAAIVCPITNTGVFLLGCFAFFMKTIASWAIADGFGKDIGKYIIFGMVSANFLVELVTNIILSPIVVRLINARNKM